MQGNAQIRGKHDITRLLLLGIILLLASPSLLAVSNAIADTEEDYRRTMDPSKGSKGGILEILLLLWILS
jgi:hypothetical protein